VTPQARTASSPQLSLLACGDCGPVHGPADGFPISRYTELVRPLFEAADLRFANCERQYSARPAPDGRTAHGCQPPEMADIFTDCRFDVLSLANNHMFDGGAQALLDTRELMLGKGIAVSGAGKDLDQAREPAILERNGIRVGFVSFCSALSKNSEAAPGKPGVAPLRVKTSYEHRGPHAPVRVITEPDEQDMQAVLADVAALRKRVDVVVVSFHWGVIWAPRIIADYQVAAAHACIDAGADLILGHHAHVPKAIEVYKGKTIFYSLCHLCMTKPDPGAAWKEAPWVHGALRNHADLDPAMPFLPYGRDAQKSLLARAVFNRDGVVQVSFLPLTIDRQYRPVPLERSDPRFGELVDYMEWASEGFAHCFTVSGNEVMIGN